MGNEENALKRVERFHPKYDNSNLDLILSASFRVPLEIELQQKYLLGLRISYLKKDNDRYLGLVRDAMMSEREIIARKPFYLSYARMLSRHVTLSNLLADESFIKYVAENMIDGGEAELVAAGIELQKTLDRVSNSASNKDYIFEVAPVPVFPDSVWNDYRANPLSFIVEQIETKWKLSAYLSRIIALTAELLQVDINTAKEHFPGEEISYADFLNHVQSSILKELLEHDENDWAICFEDIFRQLTGNEMIEFKSVNESTDNSDNKICTAADCPDELQLKHISNLFFNENKKDEAIKLGIKRFKLYPNDPMGSGLLGSIFHDTMAIEKALYLMARTYHLLPNDALTLYMLGRIFNAGYFSVQTDLCREQLKTLPEYRKDPAQFQMPVQLFIKCESYSACSLSNDPAVEQTPVVAMLNRNKMGNCPVQLLANPGKQKIGWAMNDQVIHEIDVDLQECTVSKFKLNLSDGIVSDEISRDGSITLFRDGGVIELRDIVKDFLVESLDKLPNPSVQDVLSILKK